MALQARLTQLAISAVLTQKGEAAFNDALRTLED